MISDNSPVSTNSWLRIPLDSDFSIFNIPFGIARLKDGKVSAVSRIGDFAINLSALNRDGAFADITTQLDTVLSQSVLNDFIALGKSVTSKVRNRTQKLFVEESPFSQDEFIRKYLIPVDKVEMLIPVRITDYTDFYSSLEHAVNVGSMFRDPSNPLPKNWKHLPAGYHGRVSTIVVSGTEIHRPKGQVIDANSSTPVLSPSGKVDFELELAFIIGKESKMGSAVSIENAEDHIFGMVLFNDLSARDIQFWENVPLGPFLSKNFGSVLSPWIITMEALQPFRTEGPPQQPEVLEYLKISKPSNFDINLEVYLKPDKNGQSLVSTTNFRYMYWSMSQQLAHHTINGCKINVGDLYASGTISGNAPGTYGSLLELTKNGQNPIKVGGKERFFIDDYDSVIMKGYAKKEGMRVGFGQNITKILPSL